MWIAVANINLLVLIFEVFLQIWNSSKTIIHDFVYNRKFWSQSKHFVKTLLVDDNNSLYVENEENFLKRIDTELNTVYFTLHEQHEQTHNVL